MSKQATGNGTIFGSQDYFIALNRGTILDHFLSGARPYGYEDALKAFAEKAQAALEAIAEDVANGRELLPLMEGSKLSELSSLVVELEQIIDLNRGNGSLASDLRRQLENPSFYATSKVPTWELEQGMDLLRSPFGLSSSRKREILKTMLTPFFQESDLMNQTERDFARDLRQINCSSAFLPALQVILDYRDGNVACLGSNGQEFASSSYIHAIKSQVYPFWLGSDLAGQCKAELERMVSSISQDVQAAQRNNDYIQEEECMVLLEALVNLEACGVSTGNLKSEVHALDWYTPMDTRKVAHLQSCLNRLGLGEQLMEDGVYGPKTSEELGRFLERWDQFMRKHGGRLEKLKSLASSGN